MSNVRCYNPIKGYFFNEVEPEFVTGRSTMKVDGVKREVEFMYIPNQIRINPRKIFSIIGECKCRAVAHVLDAISGQLLENYNGNVVILSPKEITKIYKSSISEVNRAIRILKDERVITKFSDCMEESVTARVDKNTYFVTPSYILYGNVERVQEEFSNQNNHLTLDSSKD